MKFIFDLDGTIDANDITMFRHAGHSVMIGNHKQLKQFSTEQLPCDEKIEEMIIQKLDALSFVDG